MVGFEVRLHSPQKIGPGRKSLLPQAKPVEAAISEEHHPRLEATDKRAGELDLRGRVGADDSVEDGVGATLGERYDAGLGERRLFAVAHPWSAEERGVLFVVGDIEAGAVDRHEASANQPRTWRIRCRQRPGHTDEQLAYRFCAEPGPGLEDRRLRRADHDSDHLDDHDKPSVSWASTSS